MTTVEQKSFADNDQSSLCDAALSFSLSLYLSLSLSSFLPISLKRLANPCQGANHAMLVLFALKKLRVDIMDIMDIIAFIMAFLIGFHGFAWIQNIHVKAGAEGHRYG